MKRIMVCAVILSFLNVFSYSSAEPLRAKHLLLREVSARTVQENDQPDYQPIRCDKQQACIVAGCLCVVAASYYNVCGACVIPASCRTAYLLAEKRNKETIEEMKRD